MRRFAMKYLGAVVLFLMMAGYYQFIVVPNISGDLGRLAKIPFGVEQAGLGVNGYKRAFDDCAAKVVDVNNPDSVKHYRIITIGDSFSQCGKYGYQYPLSVYTNDTIANFNGFPIRDVLRKFLILFQNGYFKTGQLVILESVERAVIGRFCEFSPDSCYTVPIELFDVTSEDSLPPPFLSSFFSWVRLRAGYENPTIRFSLTRNLFSSNRYARKLYVYNSVQIDDGDLLWSRISTKNSEKAVNNMKQIIELAEDKGINLLIMVACDKYDAYEPWIKERHTENPTMKLLPKDNNIYVSRDCLRNAIASGIKDVYKVNDTHWSVVGADIVGKDLYEWIKNMSLFPSIK